MRVLIAVLACLATTGLASAAEQKIAGADDPLSEAARELRAGRSDAALALVSAAGKDVPEDLMHAVRGTIYFEQGKLEEAISDFRAAHEKNATLSTPWLFLGDALMRQKKWEEARVVYEEMMRQTNVFVLNERLRYAIFCTYLGAKDEAKAKTAFERIVFPTESPAYYYAQAAWAFAHGREKAGEKWIKTAADMFDERKTAWFARPLYDLGWIKTKPPVVLE